MWKGLRKRYSYRFCWEHAYLGTTIRKGRASLLYIMRLASKPTVYGLVIYTGGQWVDFQHAMECFFINQLSAELGWQKEEDNDGQVILYTGITGDTL